MQSFVEEAIMFSEENNKEDIFGKPRIMVLGVGGAGNNTINRLYHIGIEGAEMIAINTDKQHLDAIDADKKILIGRSLTRGLGAGGEPEIGRKAVEYDRELIKQSLKNVDLVFLSAGMGGGTGTGATPVVAEIAKAQGAIVIGVVSSPFHVERARMTKAKDGIDDLRLTADTVIVLDNNKLLDYVPNLSVEDAFSAMDQMISDTVKGITETITQPSLINLDYADIKTVMSYGGIAVMLIGEAAANHSNKAEEVVRAALRHPLLDVDYNGATGSLIHITGGHDLTIRDAEKIAAMLTEQLDSRANVIWGARVNDDHEGRIKLMAIMTGVKPLPASKLDINIEKRGGREPKRESNYIDII
jgi:cell division protein FtsZ